MHASIWIVWATMYFWVNHCQSQQKIITKQKQHSHFTLTSQKFTLCPIHYGWQMQNYLCQRCVSHGSVHQKCLMRQHCCGNVATCHGNIWWCYHCLNFNFKCTLVSINMILCLWRWRQRRSWYKVKGILCRLGFGRWRTVLLSQHTCFLFAAFCSCLLIATLA